MAKTTGRRRAKANKGRARRDVVRRPSPPAAPVEKRSVERAIDNALDDIDIGENWMEARPTAPGMREPNIITGGKLDDDLALGALRGRENARAPKRDVYETLAGRNPTPIERGGRVSAQAAQGKGSVLGDDDDAELKERVRRQGVKKKRRAKRR